MSDDLMKRRRLILGGVAACAAMGGAGLAWWRRPSVAQTGFNDSVGVAIGRETTGPGVPGFWDLAFESPDGKSLTMATLKGQPLLINFWATWCPPCVEELPLIERFFVENSKKGWQVLGLAVDQRTAVNGFLAKMPLSFLVGLAGMSGVELSKSLGNLNGGLPFTVVIGSGGDVLHRKMGRVSLSDLGAWAQLK